MLIFGLSRGSMPRPFWERSEAKPTRHRPSRYVADDPVATSTVHRSMRGIADLNGVTSNPRFYGNRPLINQLIGHGEHASGNIKTKRSGRLQVDDKLELGRLHNR